MKKITIKHFKSKQQVINYIVKLLKKDAECICIQGSTAFKPLKKFSDMDFHYFAKKYKKPYYEIVFVKDKPILISVYHQKYTKGKKIKAPKRINVVYGDYNNKLVPDFSKAKYKLKDKITRECQLVTDFLFKYFRSGDKTYLEYTQKRLNWEN